MTACVLVAALALQLLQLSYKGFALTMSLVFVVAAWEWANMAGLTLSWQRLAYAGFFSLLLMALFNAGLLQQTNWLLGVFVASLFGWLLALFAVCRYPEGKIWNRRWLMVLAGCLLLVPAWLGFLFLQPLVINSGLIWLVIAVVAAADIGAYFSGRRFGRRKLAVHVSPGKTWEGFWGGAVANVLLATAVALHLDLPSLQCIGFIVAMVFVAAASVLGDLFESMVKRERGIKDSSQLLPGHGGVLDRIDGWTAAVPMFTLFYLLYGR
ncbi:MAG TPA: phosphatidate cytidylyltransferase [Pseudomonadales bacterium]|nr:phosphatidate cytidylyltransferase [Pseudomonadales bacterium]